jgi:hypothetical protein
MSLFLSLGGERARVRGHVINKININFKKYQKNHTKNLENSN